MSDAPTPPRAVSSPADGAGMTEAALAPTDGSVDLDALADREFPRLRHGDTLYLNNASTGPLSESTLSALATFNAMRAEPWRFTQEVQFGILDRGRDLVARLIGATPGEVALTVNTSYGINLAARALPLAPGEVVLTSDREYPSNIYPWMALEAARGVRFERVPCNGRLADEEAILEALDRPGVRVLVLSWVSFETGGRLDLGRIGRACRARGIWFVVDAIQGVGAVPIDVSALPVDILACGAQKWLLAPWGTGFVYVRRDLVPRLDPVYVGWMSVRDSDDFTRMLDYDFTYRDDARRFELITLPYHDFAGLNAALDLFFEGGPARIAARVEEHVTHMVEWVRARDDMTLVTPVARERRAGIVAVVPGDPPAASARLAAAGVAHSVREGAIRLSPHWFTPREHVEAALRLLAGERR